MRVSTAPLSPPPPVPPPPPRGFVVYELPLAGGHFWVGAVQLSQLDARLAAHARGAAAAWTARHAPAGPPVLRGLLANEDDARTAARGRALALMAAHGVARVRGAEWTAPELPHAAAAAAAAATGGCALCGITAHAAASCALRHFNPS
jgi:hypothetical protein